MLLFQKKFLFFIFLIFNFFGLSVTPYHIFLIINLFCNHLLSLSLFPENEPIVVENPLRSSLEPSRASGSCHQSSQFGKGELSKKIQIPSVWKSGNANFQPKIQQSREIWCIVCKHRVHWIWRKNAENWFFDRILQENSIFNNSKLFLKN